MQLRIKPNQEKSLYNQNQLSGIQQHLLLQKNLPLGNTPSWIYFFTHSPWLSACLNIELGSGLQSCVIVGTQLCRPDPNLYGIMRLSNNKKFIG